MKTRMNFSAMMTAMMVMMIMMILTLTLISAKKSFAFYQGSTAGYVTQVTARDNGMYVVFLSGIPDQGCDVSDRAALSPNLTGAKNILSTIQLAMAAHWKIALFVDGCINHTESTDNPEYSTTEVVPRLVHAVLYPE